MVKVSCAASSFVDNQYDRAVSGVAKEGNEGVANEGKEGKAEAKDYCVASPLIVNQDYMDMSMSKSSKSGVKNQEINSLGNVREGKVSSVFEGSLMQLSFEGEAREGCGKQANDKFTGSWIQISEGIIENIKGVGNRLESNGLDEFSLAEFSNRRRPCKRVEEGDLGGPPIDIFVDLLSWEPMIEEGVSRKSSSKGGKEGGDKKKGVNVVSSSCSLRRGRKNFFPSRNHCMNIRNVAQEFGLSGLEKKVAIFIAKKDKDNGAWFRENE
ncbi:hypothetical protein QYF36_015227 [Acer negundo]|nr:hypothetical protein QYF36_015227 [Acer negundo]